MVAETKSFYSQFLHYQLTNDQVSRILAARIPREPAVRVHRRLGSGDSGSDQCSAVTGIKADKFRDCAYRT